VGCFSTLSPWLFPRIAAHFAERYPGIDVHLHEGESYELQSLLAEGALDVVLLYSNRMIPGMVGEEIMPVRMQLAFAPTHRLASMEEVQLSELENETAILLGIHPGSGPVEMMLKAAGIQPKVGWRSNNIETIRSMVARGLGYTIIMGRPFGDFSYDGFPLAYRRIAGDVPNISVVVAYPQGAKPTAKARELINFCQEEFGGEGEGFRKELRPAEGMGLL
jgi:DNA-binding transcriptional LysR family regulator